MQVIVFETPEEKAKGLQHRPFIEDDTIFVFPKTDPGAVYHSQNVPEPFDIAFLSVELMVLEAYLVVPPMQTVEAPPGTAMAVESRAGRLQQWGFVPGTFVAP